MQIGVINETAPREKRVAATPDSVETLTGLGADVAVARDSGIDAGLTDDAYASAGAVVLEADEVIAGSDVLLTVGVVPVSLVRLMRPGSTLVGFLDPFVDGELMQAAIDQRITRTGDGSHPPLDANPKHGRPVVPDKPRGVCRCSRGCHRLAAALSP